MLIEVMSVNWTEGARGRGGKRSNGSGYGLDNLDRVSYIDIVLPAEIHLLIIDISEEPRCGILRPA